MEPLFPYTSLFRSLMPRKMVFACGDEPFPDRKQGVLQPETPIEHPFVGIGRDFVDDDRVLDSFARPFAERFLVSPIAMRIRLEKLGDRKSTRLKSSH